MSLFLVLIDPLPAPAPFPLSSFLLPSPLPLPSNRQHDEAIFSYLATLPSQNADHTSDGERNSKRGSSRSSTRDDGNDGRGRGDGRSRYVIKYFSLSSVYVQSMFSVKVSLY